MLAHFYAAALALEAAFPAIGAAFLANLAVQPLDEIVRIINTVSTSPHYHYQTASVMMEYPRDTLNSYRATKEWVHGRGQTSPGTQSLQQYGLDSLSVDLGNYFGDFGFSQSLSPAFAPSPLAPSPIHASPPSMPAFTAAGPRSPYLEVPRSGMDSYSYSNVGSVYSTPLTSPAAPSLSSSYAIKQADAGATTAPAASSVYNFNLPSYSYSSSMGMGIGTPGGLVAPPAPATVWT